MEEKEAGRLEYGRPEVMLRRPWYVWVGAGMATLWLAAVGVASLCGIALLFAERGTGAEKVLALLVLTLVCVVVGLSLILEWRAIFRRSANASAIVGLLLTFPTLFAAFAEANAVLKHQGTPVIVWMGLLTSSLAFCAWSHFQWAHRIARWMTRSLEAVPMRGTE